MSISRNVGAMSRYLTRIIMDRRFNRIRSDIWELLGRMSDAGKRLRSLVHNVDEALKHFVIPGKLFEDMGLRYFGPVDGHNIQEMTEVFKFVKGSLNQPVLIHVLTTKGKGYSFAENNATKYHGIGSFSVSTGDTPDQKSGPPKYSDVFGASLIELAREHKDIIAITAAMPDGTGLTGFMEEFPQRFYDVGIAESHAATFAAGLAIAGMRPVVAIYSTFLQRAYDQIIHDVALDNLHVVFCIDRAGLVGEDGPTHHGMFDLSYLRTIPNLTIMAPRNEHELRAMLRTALLDMNGPVAIRYPRGSGTGESMDPGFQPVKPGRPEIVAAGARCAIVAVGDQCAIARTAAELVAKQARTRPAVINARFIKPLDRDFYRGIFEEYEYVVTLESNSIAGGFGSAVLECAASMDLKRMPRILCLGLPDEFVAHGDIQTLLEKLKLDPEGIARTVLRCMR
jgi:1-deoxy-D-xylulose-5-phosphate synthase